MIEQLIKLVSSNDNGYIKTSANLWHNKI